MIVGLTGGIASGKSVCTDWFAKQGVHVVDADVIAHQLTTPEGKAFQEIIKTFAEANILLPDGRLNRAMLRERIFSSPQEKEKLEAILHPLIHAEILFQLQDKPRSAPYQLLSAPLLFENHLDIWCNSTIVIDLPLEVQIKRACRRDKRKPAEIKKIIAAQISREERIEKADFIIDNAQSLEDTYSQLLELHHFLLVLAKNPDRHLSSYRSYRKRFKNDI